MVSKATILIVEDQEDIRELLKVQLEAIGHHIHAVEDGQTALQIINDNNKQIDLFLIDRMLPDIGGIELCHHIRANKNRQHLPIIMVTALTQSENIIEGLDAGADDYITKPFDMNVLQARVRSQLRRQQIDGSQATRSFGDLCIEEEKCRVTYQGNEIQLTSTEFKILMLMSQKPGHVFTRTQLIGSIQGDSVFVTNRTIDTHIAGLRKKMGRASHYVETIRGIGYRFREDANET